jgi:hypothetical protein
MARHSTLNRGTDTEGTLTYKQSRRLLRGRAAPGKRTVGGKDAEHFGPSVREFWDNMYTKQAEP